MKAKFIKRFTVITLVLAMVCTLFSPEIMSVSAAYYSQYTVTGTYTVSTVSELVTSGGAPTICNFNTSNNKLFIGTGTTNTFEITDTDDVALITALATTGTPRNKITIENGRITKIEIAAEGVKLGSINLTGITVIKTGVGSVTLPTVSATVESDTLTAGKATGNETITITLENAVFENAEEANVSDKFETTTSGIIDLTGATYTASANSNKAVITLADNVTLTEGSTAITVKSDALTGLTGEADLETTNKVTVNPVPKVSATAVSNPVALTAGKTTGNETITITLENAVFNNAESASVSGKFEAATNNIIDLTGATYTAVANSSKAIITLAEDVTLAEGSTAIIIKSAALAGSTSVVDVETSNKVTINSAPTEPTEPTEPSGPAGSVESLDFDSWSNQLIINVGSDQDGFDADGLAYIRIGEVKNSSVKSYSTYEIKLNEGYACIDLSAYAKKGVELSVYTDKVANAKTIKLDKNADKLKITLALDENNVEDRFQVKVNNSDITDAQKLMLQYRVEGQSDWYNLYYENNAKEIKADAGDLEQIISTIEQFGSTIYFRLLGKVVRDDKYIITSCNFSSAEAKLKYPKLGKQPTVAVDYVKNTVSFPKGVQVKGIPKDAGIATTVSPSAISFSSWETLEVSKDKAQKVSIDDLLKGTSSEFTFYVRVAASAKKPSSAITAVDILGLPNKPVAAKFDCKSVPKSQTDNTLKSVSFKNNESSPIEYATSNDANATAPDAAAKWTKLNASTEKSLSKDVKVIFVRFPGAKADKDGNGAARASDYIKITVPGL